MSQKSAHLGHGLLLNTKSICAVDKCLGLADLGSDSSHKCALYLVRTEEVGQAEKAPLKLGLLQLKSYSNAFCSENSSQAGLAGTQQLHWCHSKTSEEALLCCKACHASDQPRCWQQDKAGHERTVILDCIRFGFCTVSDHW